MRDFIYRLVCLLGGGIRGEGVAVAVGMEVGKKWGRGPEAGSLGGAGGGGLVFSNILFGLFFVCFFRRVL